jgi:hypothetical protein
MELMGSTEKFHKAIERRRERGMEREEEDNLGDEAAMAGLDGAMAS